MGDLQYDFLVREKVADGALIAKWRKPGYEILCSMLAIQKGNHNFGTTSHCRWAGPDVLFFSRCSHTCRIGLSNPVSHGEGRRGRRGLCACVRARERERERERERQGAVVV
jgi:hypothetical protein